MREPNDCHGDEHILEALHQKPQRDPDEMSEAEYWEELEAELHAERRTMIALSATPEQFRDMWRKLG
jgi:hypothetical protein